ncbi:LysM peptidoglycan-binding domain-containing protein [Granulicoccus phenolivorans]|uniref:LysM peptidoglycan-binding domain-containing protein n=1 Tax=Granulicoccus phenolivorans TaxID=266854 RepID=UPI0011AE74EB|nr:LysM domain-containing protein [Granulicoccus phenolivorans]
MLAAGLMVGAAVVAAGVGVTQLAVADPAAGPVPGPVAASAEPGWLRLPDANRNGVPDAYETPAAPVPVEPATPVPPSPAPAPPDGSWIWVVRWGDTLSGISAATGVPLEILMRANGITDPNRIYAGSALRITPGA